MTATPISGHAALRAVLSIGTVALVSSGLVACSSSTTSAPSVSASQAPGAAAASESDPPATPAGSADKSPDCALFTRAEAASAMGQPLTSGSQVPAMGMCDYSTPDFSTGVGTTVSSWGSITAAAHSSGHTPTPVSGVGDEAYFGVGLSVRKGDKGVLITMGGPVIDKLPDHGLAKEKALAALILGRL